MLLPTMPLYLAETLKIDISSVGIVLSSYTIGLVFVRPFSGFMADCISRKPLYLFAFAAFALMFGGYYFAVSTTSIMLVRLLQGGFMGMTSVAGNTIAVDVIPSSRRGEGMGYYGLTINMAMSLAPLLALSVYGQWGFYAVITVGLVMALVGVLSVTFISCPKRETKSRPPLSFDRFILLEALPAALAYVLVAIPYGAVMSFVVLYGQSVGISNPGTFFLFMAIGVGASRLISGRFVDKGKIHAVSLCSQACLIVTFAVFATFHSEIVFFGCALFIGIGFGVGVPAFQCLFVNVAPHDKRGTATSTFLTSFDVGVSLGMLIGGYVSQRFSYETTYYLSSLFCASSSAVYVFKVIKSYERNKRICEA
jgi:predicted MFS family arabinose efflux permease